MASHFQQKGWNSISWCFYNIWFTRTHDANSSTSFNLVRRDNGHFAHCTSVYAESTVYYNQCWWKLSGSCCSWSEQILNSSSFYCDHCNAEKASSWRTWSTAMLQSVTLFQEYIISGEATSSTATCCLNCRLCIDAKQKHKLILSNLVTS